MNDFTELAQDYVARHPPPEPLFEDEHRGLVGELARVYKAHDRKLEAKIELEQRMLDLADERDLKDLDAVPDEAIRTLAIEAETSVGSDVNPEWGKTADSIRKWLETVRAKHAVFALDDDQFNQFSGDQLDQLIAGTKKRIREGYAKDTLREDLRTAAGRKARKVDLAELFIDDPPAASKLWDDLYGDGA